MDNQHRFFNNDGRNDLLLTSGITSRVRFSDGDGTWTPGSPDPFTIEPYEPFVGYFDGDPHTNRLAFKRTDMLLYDSVTGNVVVRHSTGTGGWGVPGTSSFGSLLHLEVGFSDADGLSDVLRATTFDPTTTTFSVMVRLPSGWTGTTSYDCCAGYVIYPGYNDDP